MTPSAPEAPLALVIVIDADDPHAQAKARAAIGSSASVSIHHVDADLVPSMRLLARHASTAPTPLSRVGKGHRCACCTSGRRAEIDAALDAGLAYRAIERLCGVSDSSVARHAVRCRTEGRENAANA